MTAFSLSPVPTWQERSIDGFRQTRMPGERWRFYVTGFDASTYGQRGTCSVLRVDGTTERVPIDERDRIQIGGRWYGRAHWTH